MIGSLATLALLAPLSLASPAGRFESRNVSPFDSILSSRQETNSTASQSCPTNNGLDPASFDTPLYTEPYRPQLHFTPSSGFMNDPNGLIKIGDTYHLYAQYNPFEVVAGNQHWAHATSKDLYTWENHYWAIAPEGPGDGIFSGSTVIDFNNTSGFFNDTVDPEQRIVAIYTLFNGTDQHQTQDIAYSLDGGFNFTKYEQNPVLVSPESATQFRDPNVFWDTISSQWVMTVALPQQFKIVWYGSADLKSWTELSEFKHYGVLGYQYECPSLVQVPTEGGPKDGELSWVLIISINPGARVGGSETQYVPGDWNGTHFTAHDSATRFIDFGKDNYAGIPYHNTGSNKTIFQAWASNWQYTQVVPTSPWRSAQSIAREISMKYIPYTPELSDYALISVPVDITPIHGDDLTPSDAITNGTSVDLVGNGGFDIQAEFLSTATAGNSSAEIHIVSSDGQGVLKLGILFGGPTLVYVDRRKAGTVWADANPFFTDRFSAQLTTSTLPTDNTTQVISFRAIVDRSITEVFANGGEASAIVDYFFDNEAIPAKAQFFFGNEGVTAQNVTVQALKSTWPEC